ncbi:mannosyl-3-phosphoglycerate phosphatase [Archaeoglobus sp.]|uniref:mannosyl-3-phosphoglycerate phosphatase n=1 Tax=Archaeoglobus sp. TaxID=1872626 RepID=UPI0025BCB10E|nr:mannosyl-3-phosphoglycerate phosphatase [Archaeoglobus sp.]
MLFTDLDATLLDKDDYSYDVNLVKKLKKKGVPIVFCSSKTRAEQEYYRSAMGVTDSFIVENGSAIYIPKDYFSFPFEYDFLTEKYRVIVLGERYQKIREVVDELGVKCFGRMSVEEVSKVTGLSEDLAKLAKQREYLEPLVLGEDEKEKLRLVEKAGLRWTYGGKFYSVIGKTDKGKAVKKLVELFRKEFGKVESIGIGDSPNDFSMLEVVDKPFLIGNKKIRNFRVVESFDEIFDEI